ncbi:MAG: barstar family protein [Rhodocyclaceae bacterium]|nr:barstar family protein [Rhodocyclaceae bacterium]
MSPRSDNDASGDYEPETVDPGELAGLERAAGRSRHRVVRLDLAGCRSKQALLERASAAFEFPDWFGHNWDALSDSLRDLSWLDAPGYLVVISSQEAFAAAQPDGWRTLCEVLAEVAAEREAEGVPWRNVRLGSGPP